MLGNVDKKSNNETNTKKMKLKCYQNDYFRYHTNKRKK